MDIEKDKIQQSIAVARMYYEQELSQNQIAAQLGISRPTVSRLLQAAKKSGLIRIQIMDPVESSEALEAKIKARYQLNEAHVVPVQTVSAGSSLDAIGQYAADYLADLVGDHDTIGIGWGKTIHSIANHLNVKDEVTDVSVVQLKGSVSYSKHHTYGFESINAFAAAFRTIPQYLPLPVIFDQKMTKDLVEKERHIQHLIELGKKANIAVFTVGTVRDSALVLNLNYFAEDEIEFLQDHAVGDVFSRFIDEDGKIVCDEINQRTIGIQLSDLTTKDHSILVVTGEAKVAAIDAALRGKYANTLIIDQHTAQQLINYRN
ncbi:sugar-binding transcriptional regulator [Paucilactobacillus nenjiangensis]|uniref:sugar-binding transcriptional regulator n=1 Tax=Paucilactobacillus nenjiangensis TaxID=1296540 RepID=UPI003BB5A719